MSVAAPPVSDNTPDNDKSSISILELINIASILIAKKLIDAAES